MQKANGDEGGGVHAKIALIFKTMTTVRAAAVWKLRNAAI